jgi:prepilin-type N-terminal cleavage/methylation domain-containing protein
MNTQVHHKSDSGFTLVELLYVMALISILTSMSWGAFAMYKNDAEYARAETTLHNARSAIEVGDQEATVGSTMPFTYSNAAGDLMADDSPLFETYLPGMTVPPGVRVGLRYTKCNRTNPDGSPNFNLSYYIVSQPCNADKQIRYYRWCDGFDWTWHELNQVKGSC